jgi:purine-binding chemotaxis protein CheW
MPKMTDEQRRATASALQDGDGVVSPSALRYCVGDRFLIFSEQGLRYALPASRVREALLLPRLTVLEETPPWVVGAFERHGMLVPLIGPALALHHQPSPAARVSDLGIIADRGGHMVALHADAVLDLAPAQRVLPIPPDRLGQLHRANNTTANPGDAMDHPSETISAAPIIEYEIALEQGMVPVLEIDAIRLHAQCADEVSDLPEHRLQTFERELTETDKDRLAARTLEYSGISVRGRQQDADAFVVFELAGERFAFAASESVELARIGNLFPVPGAPSHVLGFSPLRGDVITLVDVRTALGLATRGFWEPPMMVVMRYEGQLTGIAIDSSLGLVRANRRPVDELPLKLRHAGARWLIGAIHPSGDIATAAQEPAVAGGSLVHPLAVINLEALLAHGGLVVEQG